MRTLLVIASLFVGCCTFALGEPTQWIVVTAPAYPEAIEPLRQHRLAEGFEVRIALTSEILSADEITRGKGDPLAAYLRKTCKAYNGASAVLLVGAVLPAKGEDRLATTVPMLRGVAGRMTNKPTDNGFGCLAESMLPEVAVGRLPAQNANEAKAMIEKILAFERTCQTASWRRSIALLIGDPGGSSSAEKALSVWYANSACRSTLGQIDPAWQVRTICHIPGSPWCPPGASLHDEAMASVQSGSAFVIHMGHCSPDLMWSGEARFLDRQDFSTMKMTPGGIFMACGCYTCQLDPAGRAQQEGFALAAIRNATGPAAAIGSFGESYAVMGHLAFAPVAKHLSQLSMPDRLGELWLEVKRGITRGEIDFLTFTMFDMADGSQGRAPLLLQRKEHLEMWMLLGDPAMRLPAINPEMTLNVPGSISADEKLIVRGKVPAGWKEGMVRLTLERPLTSAPLELDAIPVTGSKDDQTELTRFRRMNDLIVNTQTIAYQSGQFEAAIQLPRQLPWPSMTVRASTERDGAALMGVASVTIAHPATTQRAPVEEKQ